jgi:hypothetical protein
MIFNDDLIFIHIGKTGGMSCSAYLLDNLRPPVYNCHSAAASERDHSKNEGVVIRSDAFRHFNLAEALKYIEQFNGKQMSDFRKVVAVIRHPYTLEYSFYEHMQKPGAKASRRDDARLLELADGTFKDFVANAGYHRKDHTQDDFVRLNNGIPDRVELVRFEELSLAFPRAVAAFLRRGATQRFPHVNRTAYQTDIRDALNDEVMELIYKKHRFMFDSGLYSTTFK